MSQLDERLASLEAFPESYSSQALSKSAPVNELPVSTVESLLAQADVLSEPNEKLEHQSRIQGRVILKRNNGRIAFAQIRDLHPSEGVIQLFFGPQFMEQEAEGVELFKKNVYIGDILNVVGQLGLSNTGEKTLFVTSFSMNAKCLNFYPKEVGLELNKETIHSDPVLHLLVSAQQRELVRSRARIVSAVRRFFESNDFLEVDTPMLSSEAGGASADRFTTYSTESHSDLFLRVASELYLKQLVIGGVGNVFEIGKNFRNEGLDRSHSPEFLALESYQVGSDYTGQTMLIMELLKVLDETGELVNSIEHVSFFASLNAVLDEPLSPLSSLESVQQVCAVHNVPTANLSAGQLFEDLFDELVIPSFGDNPIFVYDYPTETSPLAMANGDGTSQKWDLYIRGLEVATAYTENADPIVQESTLVDDPSFVHAVKYGMPAMGGMGIGIDRLAMVLLGTDSIHQAQAFSHGVI